MLLFRSYLRRLQCGCYAFLALSAFAIPGSAAALGFINLPNNVTVQADTTNWDFGFSSTQVSPGNITFNGGYVANLPLNVTGVVYIVDPGTNIIAAKISITFTILSTDVGPEQAVTGTFLAAPAGGSLGTLPSGFAGIPANPSTSVSILGDFADPTTGAPVSLPSNITIQAQSQLVFGITSPQTLPAGDICVASASVSCSPYSFTFTATGGPLPVFWDISSGTPPAGLSLNAAATGIFSGSATGPAGQSFFDLTATDATFSAFQSPTLTVNPQPLIMTTSLPTGVQGSPYSAQLTASGGTGAFTWAAGQLNTGTINFPAGLFPAGLPFAASGNFPAIEYITPPIADGDQLVVGNLAQGAFTTIQAFPLPSSPRETFANATVPLAAGQSFSSVQVPTAAERTGDFSDFAGLLVDPTTGQPFPGGIIPTSRLGGLYAFRIGISRTGANVLPPGLSLSTTGVLSGIPTVRGTFQIPVQATDSALGPTTLITTLPLTIIPLLVPVPPIFPAGEVNSRYSFQFHATGGSGSYSWSLSSGSNPLPPGLTLNTGGALSGIPTTAGSFSFGVNVSDGRQTASEQVSLAVNPRVGIVTPSPLAIGQVGKVYSATLSASPGVPPFTWGVAGGILPSGLQLAPGGALTGTPTTASGTSPFSFTAQVTDSFGATASQLYQLAINPATPVLTVAVPAGTTANSQPTVQVSPGSQYPSDINGTLTLTFDSAVGADDGKIVFMGSGLRTLTFTIPANSTNVVFEGNTSQFQAGTTAGTITVTTSLKSNGQDLTPVPANVSISIAAAAPQIVGQVTATRTAGGFSVIVTGFCTARQVTEGKFSFAGTTNLRTNSLPIQVNPIFTSWYQNMISIGTGTQFTYAQLFTTQGNPNDVTSVTVVLTGPQGDSQAVTAQIQ